MALWLSLGLVLNRLVSTVYLISPLHVSPLAARRRSLPAAGPHLTCNSSATEHIGPVAVERTPRCGGVSQPAKKEQKKKRITFQKSATEDGEWARILPECLGQESTFELEGVCVAVFVQKKKK